MDPPLVLVERARGDPVVELVGIERPAARNTSSNDAPNGRPPRPWKGAAGRPRSRPRGRRGRSGPPPWCRSSPGSRRALPDDHVAVEGVLDVRRGVGVTPEPLVVRLVLREEQLRGAVARRARSRRVRDGTRRIAPPPRAGPASGPRRPRTTCSGTRASAAGGAARPRGRGCGPTRGSGCRPGPALAYSTKTSKYRSSSKIPVSISSYSSSSLDRLRFVSTRSAVGVLPLRVLVEVLHVGVGRRGVEVEVVLLDVLAVVALAVGQAEQPFLQDGVPPVPQREREAEALLVVGDPRRGRPRPSGTPGSGPGRA